MALSLNLPLLYSHLAACLLFFDFLILHLVAHHRATDRAKTATDCRTSTRVAKRRADYRSGTSAQRSTEQGSLLASA
jgi:hypothetical protein